MILKGMMIRNHLFSLMVALCFGSLGAAATTPCPSSPEEGTATTADSLLVAQGDSCMEQYDYYHAMQYYTQVAEADDMVKSKLATCYFLRADYRRCVALLEQLPDSVLSHDALRQLFYSYKALDDKTTKQRRWGERLLARFPMDSEVVADMALAYNLFD
jgi:thioredoxin-like negative regulator of GroEL